MFFWGGVEEEREVLVETERERKKNATLSRIRIGARRAGGGGHRCFIASNQASLVTDRHRKSPHR